MSHRGRTELVYESDDSSGYYEVPPPAPRHRSRSRIGIRVVEDKYDTRPARGKAYTHRSYNDAASSHAGLEDNVIIHNHLNIPKQSRPRAASTGGSPAPNYIPVYLPTPAPSAREVSQERRKWHREKRTEYSSSEDDSDYGRHRRRRSKRRSSRERSSIAAELAELARIRQELTRKDTTDPEILKKLAQLEIYEQEKKFQAQKLKDQQIADLLEAQRGPKDVADKLARLNALERQREQEEEEAAWEAKMEEKKRRDKKREEELKYKYDEAIRKQKEAAEDAVNRAQAARDAAEAKAEAEHNRIIAEERDKAAKAAAKEKAEAARILAEAKAKAAEAKTERERIVAEEKARLAEEKLEREKLLLEAQARAAKEKKEAEEERKRIIAEEKERERREKEEHEELVLRILAEEKKRKEEEKAKKKAEDDVLNQKMKEKLMNAGYSKEYIDDILEEETEHGRKGSTSRASVNSMAIQLSRPTYIRVKARDLLPETLNHYALPWEYDPADSNHILIKEWIDHDFQQVLFQHTKRIYRHRESHMLEGHGYTKTVTTLKPEVYKNKDEMYLVRRKSTGKSPSRPRGRNFMFT